MEKSTIYNLISMGILQEWRQAEEDKESYFTDYEKELIEKLKSELTERSMESLNAYSLAVENRMDYLYYNLNIKVLNLGIQIGLELGKAIAENERD